MEPMRFTYSFTINGYDVTVTIEFFPYIVVLEDSSPLATPLEIAQYHRLITKWGKKVCSMGLGCEVIQ